MKPSEVRTASDGSSPTSRTPFSLNHHAMPVIFGEAWSCSGLTSPSSLPRHCHDSPRTSGRTLAPRSSSRSAQAARRALSATGTSCSTGTRPTPGFDPVCLPMQRLETGQSKLQLRVRYLLDRYPQNSRPFGHAVTCISAPDDLQERPCRSRNAPELCRVQY